MKTEPEVVLVFTYTHRDQCDSHTRTVTNVTFTEGSRSSRVRKYIVSGKTVEGQKFELALARDDAV